MTNSARRPWGALAALALLLQPGAGAFASEGASSDYLPGLAGAFAPAAPPRQGLTAAYSLYLSGGDTALAVLQGRIHENLRTFALLNIAQGAYAFERPILGGRYAAAVFVPAAYLELDAAVRPASGPAQNVSASAFNLADSGLTPISLYWTLGEVHVSAAETIIMPTGAYDKGKAVNVGRNYWAFDTTASFTYISKIGTELSGVFGFMVNTTNTATDYRTGEEFHFDGMLNQYLSDSFGFGVQGYYYRQVSADSGSGAVLGSFKGEGAGIGPALLWRPAALEERLAVTAKWLHDVRTENRLKQDWGQVTVAYNF